MKKIKVIVILGALTSQLAVAGSFTLSSKSLPQGGAIGPDLYWNNFGCSGKNIMPDLQWANAPKGVKSYAITMYDKDAPTGSGFWHRSAVILGLNEKPTISHLRSMTMAKYSQP
jgi:phosphatidylethanolamine-binding protein (PEBP) family uncharacterized protein